MKRFDLLGVPGVGKTTTFNLLRQFCNNTKEFLLFDEAYRSVMLSKLSPFVRFAFYSERLIPKRQLTIRFIHILNKWLDNKLQFKAFQVEKENLFRAIQEMWNKYPDFMAITLNGIGKQSLVESIVLPSDYFGFLIKTANRINQYDILQRSLGDKTPVIFDNSITHKVFSIVDFSRKINPELITRYIRDMPQPKGTIIITASPKVLVSRIRNRAKEGIVNTWHRPIVDSALLEDWVSKACEVIQYTRISLQEGGVPVIDLDGEEPPTVLAQRAIEFIVNN